MGEESYDSIDPLDRCGEAQGDLAAVAREAARHTDEDKADPFGFGGVEVGVRQSLAHGDQNVVRGVPQSGSTVARVSGYRTCPAIACTSLPAMCGCDPGAV